MATAATGPGPEEAQARTVKPQVGVHCPLLPSSPAQEVCHAPAAETPALGQATPHSACG